MRRLTEAQERVLKLLDHEAQTSSRLAYTLERRDSSCRSLVRRLMDRGLVASVGRAGILFLTEAGRAALAQQEKAGADG